MALDVFDVAEFQRHLTTNEFGKKFIYKEITATTMDDALKAANEGTPNGTAILAEQQSNARGLKNRKWNAQYTGNIYVSYVYYREPRDEDLMEVASALAVYSTLQDFGVEDIYMKWLNDIWVRGHKMAGILVEDKGPLKSDNTKRVYIVGIGVNVNSDVRRHPELHRISTSARSELHGNRVSRELFLAKMSKYLEEFLPLAKEDLHVRVMKVQLFQVGQPIKVHSDLHNRVEDAVIEEFLEDWSLKLKDDSGKVWTINTNDYSIRPCMMSAAYVYNGKLACPWSSAAMLRTLSSLLDTTHTAISLLNDAKMKDGLWSKDAALLVVGEISIETEQTDLAHQTMMDVLKFIHDGGVVMMTGNMAGLFTAYLEAPSPSETTCSLQPSNGNPKTGRLVIVDATSGDTTQVHAYSISEKNITFPQTVGQSSEILGRYSDADPAVVISKYGKGSCVLLGFNAEMTYMEDSVWLSETELEILRDTVFTRDELLLGIFKKFGL